MSIDIRNRTKEALKRDLVKMFAVRKEYLENNESIKAINNLIALCAEEIYNIEEDERVTKLFEG